MNNRVLIFAGGMQVICAVSAHIFSKFCFERAFIDIGYKWSFCSVMSRLIESVMGLRPRQGNLRLVFSLFSIMRGLPSTRLKQSENEPEIS